VTVLDIVVGTAFLFAALNFRRSPKLAVLAAATGLLWFAGDLVQPLLFTHRAPVTHLFLLYPLTAFRSRLRLWAVCAVYAASLIFPLGQLGPVTVTLFVAVLVAALAGRPPRGTADRRSTDRAGAGAVLVWGILASGTVAGWTGIHIDAALLLVYEIGLLVALTVVVIDDRYRRSRTAIVSNLAGDLAVDLGATGSRSLRDVIAQALGDPSVVIGLPTTDGFTDENGQPVALDVTSGQVVTDLLEGGQRIAILQHDPSLLRDRSLLDSVTALAAVALSNTRLQHEVTDNIAEVATSRRRLLAVADAERDRLEAEVQGGVLSRLARVAALLRPLGSADLCRHVDSTRETTRTFARGVYPRPLEEVGLAAIRDLDPVSGRMEITVPDARFPRDIEAAAYFLCVEALTNVAKYANATSTSVRITAASGLLVVDIADNGIGGADTAKGSGLLGLQDRLDVLGGVLEVQSSSQGTLIRGSIPLPQPQTVGPSDGAPPLSAVHTGDSRLSSPVSRGDLAHQ
jgi:signal transduction histidine kinase